MMTEDTRIIINTNSAQLYLLYFPFTASLEQISFTILGHLQATLK